MLEEGRCDPTVINGGIVNRYGTNIRLGQGDLVAGADEIDGTFTRLPATICVVTNIDPEHMGLAVLMACAVLISSLLKIFRFMVSVFYVPIMMKCCR